MPSHCNANAPAEKTDATEAWISTMRRAFVQKMGAGYDKLFGCENSATTDDGIGE
jgi:hypothetical protein